MLNLDYGHYTDDLEEEKKKKNIYFESFGNDLIFINIKKKGDKQGTDCFETKVNGEYINEDGFFPSLKAAKTACYKNIKERIKQCSADLKRLEK